MTLSSYLFSPVIDEITKDKKFEVPCSMLFVDYIVQIGKNPEAKLVYLKIEEALEGIGLYTFTTDTIVIERIGKGRI